MVIWNRRGGKSFKPNYLMILFLWHSLLLLATTPTCDGVYQVWYVFVVISIIKRGGIASIVNVQQKRRKISLIKLPNDIIPFVLSSTNTNNTNIRFCVPNLVWCCCYQYYKKRRDHRIFTTIAICSLSCLVAGRFDPFFHVMILHYTHPSLYKQ